MPVIDDCEELTPAQWNLEALQAHRVKVRDALQQEHRALSRAVQMFEDYSQIGALLPGDAQHLARLVEMREKRQEALRTL